MEHHASMLFDPINRLLLMILPAAPEKYQALVGTHHGYWLPDHVIMAMLVCFLVAVLLIPLRRKLSVENPGKIQQMLELTLVGLKDLIDEVVGAGTGRRFLPFVLGLATFIFVGNIFGLFFFLQPPTANPSTTFALSITAFLYYNAVGIKDNGVLKYIAHFAGPFLPLAFLMFPIEIISHLARILSLALRLFGNIFGEHTATGIFFGMFPFVVPWPMMGLGIFGALLQAFIFIMLTMAYLQGAVGHEEAH